MINTLKINAILIDPPKFVNTCVYKLVKNLQILMEIDSA